MRLQTKMEIRRAAVELFEEHGFPATTVESIAERAGVSTRTVYNHFREKEQILSLPTDNLAALFFAAAKAHGSSKGVEAAAVRGVLVILEADAERVELTRRALKLFGTTPELDSIAGRLQLEWEKILLASLPKKNVTTADRARVVTAIGLGRTALELWVEDDNGSTFEIFDQLVKAVRQF